MGSERTRGGGCGAAPGGGDAGSGGPVAGCVYGRTWREAQTSGVYWVSTHSERPGKRSAFSATTRHSGNAAIAPSPSPQLPPAAASPPPAPTPIQDAFIARLAAQAQVSPRAVVFRGLRVRMGLHTGIHLPMARSAADGRAVLPDPVLSAAKAVSDAGHGGQIVLSETAFEAAGSAAAGARGIVFHMGKHLVADHPTWNVLSDPREKLATSGRRVGSAFSDRFTSMHLSASLPSLFFRNGVRGSACSPSANQWMGGGGCSGGGSGSGGGGNGRALWRAWDGLSAALRHPFGRRPLNRNVSATDSIVGQEDFAAHHGRSCMAPLQLYLLVALAHIHRLAVLPSAPALRTQQQLSPGTLEAPVGHVAVACLQVVGAGILMAEIPDAASDAMKMFVKAVSSELSALGGYRVEVSADTVLAVFCLPNAALRWVLTCQAALMELAWPEELLVHELGEPLTIWGAAGDDGHRALKLLCRGLRLRAGVDCGEVTHVLRQDTACLQYFGTPVAAAAMLASSAKAGQVLASRKCWAAAARKAGAAGGSGGSGGGTGMQPPLATPAALSKLPTQGIPEDTSIFEDGSDDEDIDDGWDVQVIDGGGGAVAAHGVHVAAGSALAKAKVDVVEIQSKDQFELVTMGGTLQPSAANAALEEEVSDEGAEA
uniref:Guanylate cyclase domain-containing protein n=1 Tax=Chlamydomonas euryale TaxID=1486919 RepID=A0A7R9VEE9_9CHLO